MGRSWAPYPGQRSLSSLPLGLLSPPPLPKPLFPCTSPLLERAIAVLIREVERGHDGELAAGFQEFATITSSLAGPHYFRTLTTKHRKLIKVNRVKATACELHSLWSRRRSLFYVRMVLRGQMQSAQGDMKIRTLRYQCRSRGGTGSNESSAKLRNRLCQGPSR